MHSLYLRLAVKIRLWSESDHTPYMPSVGLLSVKIKLH